MVFIWWRCNFIIKLNSRGLVCKNISQAVLTVSAYLRLFWAQGSPIDFMDVEYIFDVIRRCKRIGKG